MKWIMPGDYPGVLSWSVHLNGYGSIQIHGSLLLHSYFGATKVCLNTQYMNLFTELV